MAKVTDIQDKNGVSKEIQDKDLSRQTAATAIASTDYVMLQDTSGGYHKIAKASFTEAVRSALGSVINSTAKGTDIAKVPVLDSNNDLGMGTLANIAKKLQSVLPTIGNVMVVTNVDSYTRFWPADRALESSIASIAVGVGIIENGRTLIVAKDQATKAWATSNVTGGTTAISDRRAAIADFDGRAKTSTILTTLGANAPAAKYCNEYHPSNVDSADSNMGAGRWWLPSLGEMAMIWAHVREINFVMSAISGTAIPVGSSWGWSSTEHSAAYPWHLSFYFGRFGNDGPKSAESSVRPVSAFY